MWILKYEVILYLHRSLLLCLWNVKEIRIYKHMLNIPWIWNLIRSKIGCGIGKNTKCTVHKYHKYFTCCIQICHQIYYIQHRSIIQYPESRNDKKNLYVFPHSLFLHWINYHFILLLTLPGIIATVITSHKFISVLQSESVADTNSTLRHHKHQ